MKKKSQNNNPEKDEVQETQTSSEKSGAAVEKKQTMPDNRYSVAEQSRDFGPRSVPAVRNNTVLNERFNLKLGRCEYKNCSLLIDRKSNQKVGIIPRITLESVWTKAYEGCQGDVFGKIGITKEEWNENKNIISDVVGYGQKVLVQDVWEIKEIEFEELFLKRAARTVNLIQTAIKFDIEETAKIEQEWKKIKKYKHKVALESKYGGVFSDEDAAVLRKNGVNYLNDIRKMSIYDLKNMFLSHKLIDIPAEANAAFKEDMERRKDKRFKVIPFIFGFIALAATMVVEFIFQYTLIKNTPMTLLNILMALMWLGVIATIIWGAVRAVRRRRTKRPGYRFFTKKVSITMSAFVVCSLVAMPALCVYYARYDGYNDQYFYRNVSKDEIAVAGLFDGDLDMLSIPSTIDGKQVVGITSNAFRKSDVRFVEMPNTVKDIGKSAFYKCKSLGNIKFSSGLENISKKAFYECSSLANVTLPESLVTIGDAAFSKCDLFTTVTVPKSVETIGKEAFKDCKQIISVDIDGRISELGSGAFSGCTACEDIDFADVSMLTRIENNTFTDCERLTGVDFLGNVEYIGGEAFKNCKKLTQLTVGDKLEELGKNVLTGCESLKELTIPFIGKTAENPEKFSYIGNNVPINTISLTKQLKIPNNAFSNLFTLRTVKLNNSVSEIGNSAFAGCTSLDNFSIPFGVTKINKNTFEDCSALNTVTATVNLTELGEGAFKNCTALTAAGFSTIESIGANCFEGCRYINTVVEMPKLSYVGAYAFKDCYNIQTLTLPDSLEDIADYAFASSNIQTITFGDNIKSFGKNAFENCSVREIVIGDKIETISSSAFANSNIESITLGKSVKTIENNAFINCGMLKNVSFNSNLESVGDNAFKNCAALAAADLSGTKVNGLGKGVFSGCLALNDVKLPSTVKEISEEFAMDCSSLKSINLTGIETIGKSAFKNSALNTNVLTESVKEIGESAFENCLNLMSVRIPDSVEKMGKNAFKGCEELEDVVAPFLGSTRENTGNGYKYLFGKNATVANIGITDMEKIGSGTFNGGEQSLIAVAFDETVTEIADSAFKNFKALEYVELPDKLTRIGEGAFSGCSAIEEISIPDSVTYIGGDAFRNCAKLKDVELSENLTEIKGGTFRNCVSLSEIEVFDKVEKIGSKAFDSCASLTTVKLGIGVKSLENLSFNKCVNLKTVEFNSGLEKIGWGAFLLCASLEKASYPTSAKVGAFAFLGCDSLK